MSSLLELFNQEQGQTKTASEESLQKQAQSFYELGSDYFLTELQKAAQEATEEKKEEGGESEEDYKERRKKELVAQMQESPEKRKEIEKEVSNGQ
jgi:hypothetical protein